jgi:hypothetical protein
VIPFSIGRLGRGRYGTVLSARLPRAFIKWGHITGLTMRLARRYFHGGHSHSVLSAGCPAPEGVPGATFPVARVSFGFQDQTLGSALIGSCGVRR